ncbi:MAG: IPT/TIG domain-containing protein, partial [Planctomycetota bacterium]
MRSILTTAAVVLALGLPALAQEELRGVTVGNGDKTTTDLSPAGDSDDFLMTLPAGSALTVSVKAGKGTGLLMNVTMLRPDGSDFPVTGFAKGDGTGKVSLKKVLIDETGTWAIRVTAASGTTGTALFVAKVKPPKKSKLKDQPFAAGQDHELTFGGDDGALFTFKVKVKGGAGFDSVTVEDPEGDPVDAIITTKNTTTQGKKIPLASGFGTYSLQLAAAAGEDTIADVQVQVKFAKHAKQKVTLDAEPVVTGSDPSLAAEGSVVTIEGTDFAGDVRVWFGTLEATGVTRNSTTSITATVPGPVNTSLNILTGIEVQNGDGQVSRAADVFTYGAVPTTTLVGPALSPLAGGVTLTVNGTDFRDGATVYVGGSSATNVSINSPSEITCTTPAHAAGSVTVVVTDEFGRDSNATAGHSYVGPPTLSNVTPDLSPLAGGVEITITGSGFRDGATVSLGGIAATDVDVVNATTITCMTPANTVGGMDIVVTDEFDQDSDPLSGHAYVDAPFLSGVTPGLSPLA